MIGTTAPYTFEFYSIMIRNKKQDEKNLQALKEIAALPHNKNCFDCDQRGTTYVNITIGSFVCTQCSGLLRGLNPPHRVKSINICSFSKDEIDFLRKRGNQVNAKIYLGSFDPHSSYVPDSTNTDVFKEFLTQKYDRKRWYIAPNENTLSVESDVANSSQKTQPLVLKNKLSDENFKESIVKANREFKSDLSSTGNNNKSTAPPVHNDCLLDLNFDMETEKRFVNTNAEASRTDFFQFEQNSNSTWTPFADHSTTVPPRDKHSETSAFADLNDLFSQPNPFPMKMEQSNFSDFNNLTSSMYQTFDVSNSFATDKPMRSTNSNLDHAFDFLSLPNLTSNDASTAKTAPKNDFSFDPWPAQKDNNSLFNKDSTSENKNTFSSSNQFNLDLFGNGI